MMNGIFLFCVTLTAFIALGHPELVGEWQAKRDIAYEAMYETVWETETP